MTENEARGYIKGKLDCMNECGVFNREDSENTDLCDNCHYCYSQGNFGQQKEAFSMAIKALEKQISKQNDGWISIDERLPDTDDYILLSFSNFTIPLVGRYEADKDGSGAFYIGDELETCLSQNIFVNAWQPLPEPYKECEKE